MIVLGLLVINISIYLEKFYIKIREKLVELGKILVDPKYVIDFQNLEMHSKCCHTYKEKSRVIQT